MLSFAANIIAGMPAVKALEASLYDVSGMAPNSREAFAYKLLAHPHIAQAIAKANEEALRGGRLVKQDAIAILEAIAEANLGDFLKFESDVVTDSSGRTRRVLLLETKDSQELTREQLACIQEISEGANGKVRIKLKSATDALKQLSAMHGWNAPPKAPVDGEGNPAPAVALLTSKEEYLKAREEALREDDC